MTTARWIFTGLPLILFGIISLYNGLDKTTPQDALMHNSIGAVYILAGILAGINKPWSRVLAIIAWIPFLIMIPIGTIFAVIALIILLVDPVKAENFRQAIQACSPDEVADIVGQAAIKRFEIKEHEFHIPLVDELRLPTVEVTGLIQTLETDFVTDLDDEVSPSTTSVQDIIDVLTRLQIERFPSA